MKKRIIRLVSGVLAGGLIASAHGAVDEDFMRYVEDVYKSADSNVALKDKAASGKDARELVELFKEIEAHYVKKGDAEQGVKLSTQSVDLAGKLVASVEAGDFDGAGHATREIGRTCKSCHNFYKN